MKKKPGMNTFWRAGLLLAMVVGVVTALSVAGCAVPPPVVEKNYDQATAGVIKASFTAQGQAQLTRIEQDPLQKACSAEADPPADVVKLLEARELATIKWPAGARYLGDWKEGERLAQNGRGMTWSDQASAPAGGNCYNCHQISKTEISYGTLGPSLYNYGKLRGVRDPYSPSSAAIVTYTWGKLYNSKAYNACSNMPRFGAAHVLTEKQMQDLMALLLDPASPVNQ